MKGLLSVITIIALAFIVNCQAQARDAYIIFTTPGDDGNVGQVNRIEIRWKSIPPASGDTLNWWNNGSVYNYTTPKSAGIRDTVTIANIPNTIQYFMAVGLDEVGNRGGWSNVAVLQELDIIAPSRIGLIVTPKP